MASKPTSISSLSSDGLGHIVKYLRGESICLLFSCGSPRLTQLLTSHGCVPEFRMYRRDIMIVTRSIEPLIHFKGLLVLSIKLVGVTPTIRFLCTKTLYQLPKSLQKIEFYFNNSEECWLRDSPRQGSRSYVPPENQPAFDFKAAFPDLHSLHLLADQLEIEPGWASSWAQHAKLRKIDLACLPPLLTSLKLPANGNLSSAGLAALPKGIEVLHLRMINANDGPFQENLLRLPLRTLQLDYLDFGSTPISQWPSTLKTLRIMNTTRWHPDFMPTLPWTLHKLKINLSSFYTSPIASQRFPEHLLSLTLEASCYTSDVKHLPSNLTSLNLLRCISFDISIISLPTTLTHLLFPAKGAIFTTDMIKDLPSALRVLSVPRVHPDACAYLPPRLEELSLTYYQGGDSEAITKVKLPSTLWRLGSSDVPFYRMPTAFNPILRSSGNPISPLPRATTHVGDWKTASDIVSTSDLSLLQFVQSRLASPLNLTVLALKDDCPDIMRQCMLFGETGDCPVPYFSAAQGWSDQDRMESKLLEWILTAARYGSFNVLKMLHEEFGVPLNHRLTRPGELLQCVVVNNYSEILNYLLQKRYDLLVKDENNGWTIFHLAASKLTSSLLEWLETNWQTISDAYTANHNGETITWGEAINAKADGGLTPLHVAAMETLGSDIFNTLDWLVSKGADLHAPAEDGQTVELLAKAQPDTRLQEWVSKQN